MTDTTSTPPDDEPAPRLRDMGGVTGPTPPMTRGGGGLGPADVREADEVAKRGDPQPPE